MAHRHPATAFHPDELRASELFTDVEEQIVVTVVPFPTRRYLTSAVDVLRRTGCSTSRSGTGCTRRSPR